jgi:putative alpha-1,2-mannosidase
MSIWDTHRSWNPLMVLVQPDIATAVARSLVRMTKEGGTVPRWPLAHGFTGCMVGNHAAQVVLDTWIKGLQDFDVDVLWEGLLGQALFTNNSNINRADLENCMNTSNSLLQPCMI